MKKIISTLIILLAFACANNLLAVPKAKSATQIEHLKYNAYWHWGFIWKQAGSGTLTLFDEVLADSTHRYHGQVCGRSHSIVETIMQVRDTLDTYYTPQLIPLEYSKKTNEGSYKAIERNYYHNYVNGNMIADASTINRADVDSTRIDIYRWRNKKGNDRRTVSSQGVGFDMLSIFYEIRNLDFEHMAVGKRLKYSIISGVKKRPLNMEFRGKTTCTLRNGKKYPAYRIELTFDSKDSDSTPLQVWLAATPDHRPLSVTIQLKRIGSVCGEIEE